MTLSKTTRRTETTMNKLKLNPHEDGVTHINVSYLAKTELGKLLNDSSELTIPHTPYENNPDQMVYHFTAYGYLTFLLTGSKDYWLAGAPIEDIREHLRNSDVRWDRATTRRYESALKKRIEQRKDVWTLLSENRLPIVSYTVVGKNDTIVIRKNDRVLVRVYNKISSLLSNEVDTPSP